jgi:hypothetical protein
MLTRACPTALMIKRNLDFIGKRRFNAGVRAGNNEENVF